MGRSLWGKTFGTAWGRAAALLQIAKARLAAIAFTVTAGRWATTAMARVALIAATTKSTLGCATAVTVAIATARRIAKAALLATAAATAGGEITTLGGALHGLQARHHSGLEALLAVAFDIENLAAVAELGKGHGQAVAARTAGAADAVGVVLGLHGQTEVEHVGDGGHVNAACSHIGGHQNLHLPVAQRHQPAVA
jgi:hypothetical protein